MSGAAGWIDELLAHRVVTVAELLGLEVTGRAVGPCPACGEGRRGGADKRLPVGTTKDGKGWRCQRCKAGGDAANLAALVVAGAAKPDRAGWGCVRAWAAGRGLCRQAPGAAPVPAPRLRPLPAPVEEAPSYPPAAEVAELWGRCRPVVDDADVAAWLEGRGLRPCDVADLDLARALPVDGRLPRWAGTKASTWSRSGHLLVTPLHGVGRAEPVSLRARAVVADPWKKALAPAGYAMTGLVFADGLARGLLVGREGAAERVRDVGLVVAEGDPDYLTAATLHGVDGGLERAPAVVGVESGAWTDELAALVPDGTEVLVHTHGDTPGNDYAARINETLGARCLVIRGAPKGGE